MNSMRLRMITTSIDQIDLDLRFSNRTKWLFVVSYAHVCTMLTDSTSSADGIQQKFPDIEDSARTR